MCGLAADVEKTNLNCKLKISNTADNADIIQSQARDTRHRRMEEVNSLCTDSGPLRAEYCTFAFHTIQPSSWYFVVTCSFRISGDNVLYHKHSVVCLIVLAILRND